MNMFDVLSMAIRNLFKRKMRTALTVLGVTVGSTLIILMTSIGVGINQSISDQMQNMQNATQIRIYNWTGYNQSNKDAKVLTDEDIIKMKQIPHVKAVTPYVDQYINSLAGRYAASFSVVGIDIDAMRDFGYTLKEGDWLSHDEPYGVLFGDQAVMQYQPLTGGRRYNYTGQKSKEDEKPKVNIYRDKIQFSQDWSLTQPPQSSSGSENNYAEDGTSFDGGDQNAVKPFTPYKVKGVGILDGGTNYEASYNVFMDYKTVVKMMSEYESWQKKTQGNRGVQEHKGYPSAYIRVDDINYVSTVAEELGTWGFDYVENPTQMVEQLRGMAQTLQTGLIVIAAVSLFVASIGIINTMLMSVYERTREIGVMKVIGARLSDIKKLFLTEAAFIGLVGGSIGLLLSMIGSNVVNHMDIQLFQEVSQGMMGGKLSIIPPWLSAGALVFSACIGLLAGYFPARRATKLSALEAIKTE